jgi:hypothetical protein
MIKKFRFGRVQCFVFKAGIAPNGSIDEVAFNARVYKTDGVAALTVKPADNSSICEWPYTNDPTIPDAAELNSLIGLPVTVDEAWQGVLTGWFACDSPS